MAKGNRIVNDFEDNVWLSVFYDGVGTYVNIINNELGLKYALEPLVNYIKIGGGYAFKTAQYKKQGVPIIRISDFNNEKVVLDNCVFYDEDISLSKYELKENDIIICLTGGTIAKLGIVQAGLGKIYLNQRVGRFEVLDQTKFEKEYVYWIARSVQSIIKTLAWGAAIPNVSPKQIEQLKFAIPPVEVQRCIITFLNDLKGNTLKEEVYFDDKIEKHIILLHHASIKNKSIALELTYQLSLVKQLRQAFLSEAMQGKLVVAPSLSVKVAETGQQLLEKIKAEKAQLIKDKKLKKEKELPPIKPEEIPFEIPEDWVWCRLGEICTKIGSGSTPKGGNYSLEGKPFFRSQNIQDNGLIYSDIKYISDLVHVQMNGTKVLADDLLLNITGGSLGRCALVPSNFEEGNVSQHVCIIRSMEVNKIFMHRLVLSPYFQKLIFSSTTGAGREGLPKYNLEQFIIPLPSLSKQNQIVSKLDDLMKTCDDLENSIKQSQLQNEQLLQQVLKEALEVKGGELLNETN